jgi:protein-L-isoaspartate(D-aspartate) O-methyltransferase
MNELQTRRMLDDIESEVRYTCKMIGRNVLDPRVMSAMSIVPRNEFVPGSYAGKAFDNGPLPIGHGQTISQPYIVALMTDLLELEAKDSVLEIGTGSGYQAAILSQLCKQVYSVEYIAELAASAQARFEKLGYHNIHTMTGNGYHGWAQYAPYDGIIVTAAASHIPPALIEQLKPGGNLVIPLGAPYQYQQLTLVKKDDAGELTIRDILGVSFVPFQGERHEEL